ncbi:MAG: hypothetical protein WKG07_43855 [Hymenobacter sp.]
MFSLVVYDGQNNVVETDAGDIAINSGFSISGQPLPEDICLEIDDEERPGRTKDLCLFERMTPLPARRTIYAATQPHSGKGQRRGGCHPYQRARRLAAQPAGGQQAHRAPPHWWGNLKSNVQRGSDMEITLEISESRDLTVVVYLTMIDQEFTQVFAPKSRATSVSLVQRETQDLGQEIAQELQAAEEAEDYETAAILKKLRRESDSLTSEANELAS